VSAADGEQAQAAELARVRALRFRLVEEHPFWGHLLLSMRVVPAPNLPTFAATNCADTIWLNLALTRHLESDQLAFVLMHELGHVVLESGSRRMRRQPLRWNVATDYAINRIVASIRHPEDPDRPAMRPPSGEIPGLGEVKALLDPRFDGRIAEAIYEMLDDDELPEPGSVDVVLPGEDGSINLPGVLDHGGGSDVHLPPAAGARAEEATERVRQAVRAWEGEAGRGDVPNEALVLVRSAGHVPSVPWERVLADSIEEAVGRDEYDTRRPDPRRAELGLIVPRACGGRPDSVVVALDTSASMDRELLGRLVAELTPLQERVVDLVLILADAEVHRVVRGAQLSSLLRSGRLWGGGGTDHRPVFEWLAANEPRPTLFIGITDLWTRFPDVPPPCPVVWVVPARHGNTPWGRIIELR